MFFLNFLLFSFIFNNFLFNRLFLIDSETATNSLINFQEDLNRIDFPFSFSINFYLISVIVSLFSTSIIYFTVYKRPRVTNPVQILIELLTIFISYSFVLFSSMYLLRFFGLSRGVILLNLFSYSILSYLLLSLIKYGIYKTSKFKTFFVSSMVIGFLTFLVLVRQNNENDILISTVNYSLPTTSVTLSTENTERSTCKSWLGSLNFKDCLIGASIQNSTNYSDSLNNIIIFNNDFYVLDVYGKVFKNSKENLFLDISSKVLSRNEFETEAGLFSLAFHPTENYFIISYSNKDNVLVVEKFELTSNLMPDLSTGKIIKLIPNASCCHYSGNIIWSNYFSDFLLSIGDMSENGLQSSDSLNTTSPKGKIILLNSKISNPDLLSLESSDVVRKDIIGFGLRNPWKTSEYKNYLIIPDIGLTTQEELNIVDLNLFFKTKKPYLFGWPHFEGTINNEISYNEIFLYLDSIPLNINSYINENSIKPVVYYQHQAPENFRAAIIGGEVISNKNSKYYEFYIFSDYLSNELFLYDFLNNNLYIVPIVGIEDVITSLAIHPLKSDTVLITTGNGNLVEILLP